jgi:hypothetical protein
MANGNLTYDIVEVYVKFGPNGVDLATTAYPDPTQPNLKTVAQVLANISMKTRPVLKAYLERAAREIREVPADHQHRSREDLRLLAMGDLSQIVFQPDLESNQIKISRSRATQFIFYSLDKWTFDGLGFFLDKDPLDPAIGNFTDRQILEDGHQLRITFVPSPQAPATRIKYNLRLRTDVRTNNALDGHAIIIVDPIIETSKQ